MSILGVSDEASATVSIRQATELGDAERGFLARAGLADVAPVEAWTVHGSNRQLAHATHGIFRYFGKFPPPIARTLLERYTEPGETVLDPMCGSGTTGVEALLSRRHAVLMDTNPLAALLSRVKVTRVPVRDSLAAANRVTVRARFLTAPRRTPVGLRDPDHWFLPETADSLARLCDAIEHEPAGACTDLMWTCLGAIVRRVSRATTQQGRLFLDVDSAVADALPVFAQQVQKAAVAVAEVDPQTHIQVLHGDVRTSRALAGVEAPLSIVHPPYFNMYRYSSVNSLEMAWLGMDPKLTRGGEVREFFKVGKPDNVVHYLRDMAVTLANVSRHIRVGGVVALMIGDTTIRGDHIRVVRPLVESLPNDLVPERIALRVPRYTEATWAASQRRKKNDLGIRLFDLVVILRRRA